MDIKYMITGRRMDGNKVLGYYLKDNLGSQGYLERKQVEALAMQKKIVNCSAQENKGSILLKGIGIKLKDLPIVYDTKNNSTEVIRDKFEIDARIIMNKIVIGYRVKNLCTNETKNISKDDTIHMVKEKLITNARVQKYNNSEILRGVGCDLSQLKRINYVKNRT